MLDISNRHPPRHTPQRELQWLSHMVIVLLSPVPSFLLPAVPSSMPVVPYSFSSRVN